MAASPSSSRLSPLFRSPVFTPIPELDKEEEEEEEEHDGSVSEPEKQTNPIPHPPEKSPAPEKPNNHQLSVLCTNCRPSPRDKSSTSVVPLDRNYEATPTTNAKTILHSLLLTLTRTKSPRPAPAPPTSSAGAPNSADYRLAAEELARKLACANRRRDEALLEVSRLRRAVLDLERRLGSSVLPADDSPFPAAVEEARAAVREFSRAIMVHVRPNRIASMLRMPAQDTKALLLYVEALLNRVFYNDFEKVDAEEAKILNPTVRCETNRANYEAIRGLTWEEVLHKGTKHYNQGFSKFCDEKMSEIVGMLAWPRAWPESLLQSFFGAAKGAWIVHLLGRCVYPGVTVMRVERGVGFEGGYLEEAAAVGGKRGAVTPVSVRMVVAPGFYLYKGGRCGVIKSVVVCGYGGNGTRKISD